MPAEIITPSTRWNEFVEPPAVPRDAVGPMTAGVPEALEYRAREIPEQYDRWMLTFPVPGDLRADLASALIETKDAHVARPVPRSRHGTGGFGDRERPTIGSGSRRSSRSATTATSTSSGHRSCCCRRTGWRWRRWPGASA
jgi:hypothetical protein